ncbi:MAG: polysaccharide deacetylase [Rubellimicrobium sp.]|nr:polysaccharide deacetylase [Rubellimicrobium sp.]
MTDVCLTFDFDATSLWVTTLRQTTATPLSRGDFGARVGVPRLLDLLARKSVMATFFTPAHTAVSHPEVVRRIRDAGHEIALHGDAHETPVGLPAGQEAALLDRQIARLRSVLGAGYRPMGYRSPAWDLSEETIGLLQDRGLIYDSSMMADDVRPYLAPLAQTADADSYRRGADSRLVELPVAWELDDFPHFAFLNKPMYAGLRNPDEVLAFWCGEFDFAHGVNGVLVLTMHPQIIGRGPRLIMLDRLIDHMTAAGARFDTCAGLAARWRDRLLPSSSSRDA